MLQDVKFSCIFYCIHESKILVAVKVESCFLWIKGKGKGEIFPLQAYGAQRVLGG
jgi:hypothetical protein